MATPISIQFNPSIHSFPSNPSQSINTKAQFFQQMINCCSNINSSSRQFSSFLQQLQLHQLGSTRFVALAAAATCAVDTVEDKLPADIHVTEIQEPNSRVGLTVEVPTAVCEDSYRSHKRVHEMFKGSWISSWEECSRRYPPWLYWEAKCSKSCS